MKKALLVLLLLAFVAGGLFAQFSFTGVVNGGFAMVKQGDDDMTFGVSGKAQANNGGRAQFNVNYTNEAKTAGLAIRVRFNGMANSVVQPRIAQGWISGLDGMLTVYGGRFGGSVFATMDPVSDSCYFLDTWMGLYGLIKPIDMVTIGLGATAAVPSFGVNFDDEKTVNGSSGIPGNDKAKGVIAFRVDVPDLLNFAAAVQLGGFKGDYNAYLTFKVFAVKDVNIAATARLLHVDDFSDAGQMIFYEYFGFNGVENLSVNLGLAQSLLQADGSDLYFRAWFWLTYAIGNIVPRLDVNYIMGGTYAYGSLNQNWDFEGNWKHNEAWSMLAISPSVQFRISGSTFFDIGYAAYVGLGDTKKDAKAFDTMNHAVYLELQTSF